MKQRLICGPTGTGKSNFAVLEAIDYAEQGYSVWFMAPHAHVGEWLISQLYARGLQDRLVVERAADMDRVLMRNFVQKSRASNRWKKEQEDNDFCDAFMDILARRRGLTDFAETPVLEKYTKLAVRLYQAQDTWMSESWLPLALKPYHPVWEYCIEHCTEPELRYEFSRMQHFPMREQIAMLEPAERLLSGVLSSPSIKARTSRQPTWDIANFINEGGIYVYLGGDVSADTMRVHIGSTVQQVCYLAKRGVLSCPVILALDEVNNYKLAGQYESLLLSTMRFFNVFLWLICQSLDFPTEEITRNVLQNTDHYWFRQGDPELTDKAARDLLGILDEYKVHHTDRTAKQMHGGVEEVERENVGTWNDTTGKGGSSKNKTIVQRPKYYDFIEERDVYQSGTEQLLWLAQKLMRLPVGTCWAREGGEQPVQLTIPLLDDPWCFPGLAEEKVEECIRIIKSRPIFEEPTCEIPKPTEKKNGTQPKRPSSGGAAARMQQNARANSGNSSKSTRPPRGNLSQLGSSTPQTRRGGGAGSRTNGNG